MLTCNLCPAMKSYNFVVFHRYATILAFDVKVERDAQELADSLGVKIFQADIIYHLFDKFMAYREELKQKKREEFRSIAVFPCKMKVGLGNTCEMSNANESLTATVSSSLSI